MGKGLIIVALGLSLIISFISLSLSSNATANTSTTVDFFENTKARLIANSGVEIYLEKMRRDKNLKGTFLNNSLSGGVYDIFIYGPDSLLNLKSIATFNGKTHTSVVTAKREKVGIPGVNSAFYSSSTNLMALNLNGSMYIDGNDHSSDGLLNGGIPLPGIGVNNVSDSSYVVNTLKPHITGDIVGIGGIPSVRSIPDVNNWLSISENFIFAADYMYGSGTYTGLTMGTILDPKITYINGDVILTGGSSGSGILVINGNFTLAGNFTFKGIVIAYGQSQINTRTVGNTTIIGAAIFVGQSIDIKSTGNCKFLYSNPVIATIQSGIKSSRFSILSWWE
jgi:hypothetical protein